MRPSLDVIMVILEKIEQEFKEALREGRETAVAALRLFKSALKNKEIELRAKKRELGEEDALEVLRREVKKRKESIEAFKKGGRDDLADKEREELEIILKYLPKQLDEKELKEIIKRIIQPLGKLSDKDFGRVMGLAMKEAKGRADGNLTSKIVKEILAEENKRPAA